MIDITLAIQAGGLSTRMGQDKALMLFLGKPLIEHILARILDSFVPAEILVVTNYPSKYYFLENLYPIHLVCDIIPGKGALGGLYTSLKQATYPLVSITACDLPFCNPDIILHGFKELNQVGGDVFLPYSQNGLEPLYAVYRQDTCLPYIKASIDNDILKVTAWFSQITVREWRVTPSEVISFFNVNTPQEFEQAEQIARLNQNISIG